MKTFAAMMLLVVANLFAVPSASAQCSNSIKPSCGVYATCFAKYCSTASAHARSASRTEAALWAVRHLRLPQR